MKRFLEMLCWANLKAAFGVIAVLSCLLTLTVNSSAAKTVIVTEEEAKLPPPKEMPPPDRGITRRPKIELADDDKQALHTPMHLQLKFKTFGGAAIDLSAFQATYIRDPTVDLTSRIKPFVQPTGIDIPDADLPPGEHFIQFRIRDSDGRPASKLIKLKILP